MPHTSTKNLGGGTTVIQETPETPSAVAVERARKRIRERYYDRPEVRRTIAALILREAARTRLHENPAHPKTP